jgi:hypothetical protein
MTKIIEDIQKCLTCKFEAPIMDWMILKNGKIKTVCEPCTIKQCRTCTNQRQVKLWERKEDGQLYDTCLDCRFDRVKCSKCLFKGLREEWKRKPDGSLYKLCPGCCEMFRDAHHNTSDADRLYKNERLKDRYHNDEVYRNKKQEISKTYRNDKVNCPVCNKEMLSTSLAKHLKYKSCKVPPIENIV